MWEYFCVLEEHTFGYCESVVRVESRLEIDFIFVLSAECHPETFAFFPSQKDLSSLIVCSGATALASVYRGPILYSSHHM